MFLCVCLGSYLRVTVYFIMCPGGFFCGAGQCGEVGACGLGGCVCVYDAKRRGQRERGVSGGEREREGGLLGAGEREREGVEG